MDRIQSDTGILWRSSNNLLYRNSPAGRDVAVITDFPNAKSAAEWGDDQAFLGIDL